jgi:hypothetical protein
MMDLVLTHPGEYHDDMAPVKCTMHLVLTQESIIFNMLLV